MIDQSVTEILTVEDAAVKCESPDDLVWIKDKQRGFHYRFTRAKATFLLQSYPEYYESANGPDNLPDNLPGIEEPAAE